MSATELPDDLKRFLQNSIPTFSAAELLLFLARHPGRTTTQTQIVEEMRPVAISVGMAEQYLALFQQEQLVDGDASSGFQFNPSRPELRAIVEALADEYNQRPVTLIRTIYAIAESKIQSFADSFRLKKP